MKIIEKNFGKTKAFTLVELLVSMTIVFMLMMMVYAPYSFYQKKAKLKLVSRELSQSFYEAKNMAVSGIKERKENTEDYITENKSVGLFLSTEEGKNGQAIFYAFPYDIDTSTIVLSGNSNIIKTTKLQEGVKINSLSGYENLLFLFDAINGNLNVFSFNQTGIRDEILDEKIEINFSYMNANSSSLQKKIIYFRNTNVVDYEN